MKYFKLFEQFVTENNQPVNEATKWNKQEFEDLNKFAKKLSKIDPKEFDPETYRGVKSAVMNIVSITDSITLFGDVLWQLKNKDKCVPKKWSGTAWVEATPEDADKGTAITEAYLKECEIVFQEGIKAIQLIDKGQGEKLASILPKLESDTDKLQKSNRKMQKSRQIGSWATNPDFYKDADNAGSELKAKVYEQFASATSNKEAQDELKAISQKARSQME
jgi:hypothetical protein